MDNASPLARELVELSSILKRLIRQEFRSSVGGAGTGPNLTQYRMLRSIQNGTSQVGQLSEALGTTQPATSIMVETMVRQGFLTRVGHATDRRRIELHLTPLAVSSLETNYRRALASIENRLTTLPRARQADLAGHIRLLIGVLAEPVGHTGG